MGKIKIDSKLLSRAKMASQDAGYSSLEEFVAHIIEKELEALEITEAEKKTTDRLRGLGYIE